MKIRYFFIINFLLLIPLLQGNSQDIARIIRDAVIRIDTSEYTFSMNQVQFNGHPHLAFGYDEPDPVCEVEVFLQPGIEYQKIDLLPSRDFTLVDSLLNINDEMFRFKVQFRDLFNSDFLKFTLQIPDTTLSYAGIYELHLQPHTNTYLKIYPATDELYIGEEKVFEMVTNHIENIQVQNDWVEGDGISYRIRKTFNQVQLHIIPNHLGTQLVSIPVHLRQPVLDETGQPVYSLPPVEYTFRVSQSRLKLHLMIQPGARALRYRWITAAS